MTSNIKRIGNIGELINEVDAEFQSGDIESLIVAVIRKDGTFSTRMSPGNILKLAGAVAFISHDLHDGAMDT